MCFMLKLLYKHKENWKYKTSNGLLTQVSVYGYDFDIIYTKDDEFGESQEAHLKGSLELDIFKRLKKNKKAYLSISEKDLPNSIDTQISLF